jgi:uncharacterized protein YjbJ (UPF0337 family)
MGYDDKARNKVEDLGGKAKEGVGKVTGNERLEREGETDQAKTTAKEGARKVKDSLAGMKDSVTKDEHEKGKKRK